jgi:long-subunit fatty acid transport protein
VKRLAFVALVVLVPVSLEAQSSLQVPVQFDFLNPGARSLALGSAFTGLADDATAAFTNPAGLTLLSRPEVSFEARGRRLESPFLAGGRLSGSITNQGTDTIAGPATDDSIDSGADLSFLSVVYPRSGWAVSAYRHQVIRSELSYQSNGVFQRAAFSGGTVDVRELPQNATRTFKVTNYGFAAAAKVGDQLSVGAGLSIYDFSLEGLFQRYGTNGFYGTPNYSALLVTATQAGDDVAISANVGILVMPSSNVRVGVTFKRGAAFAYESNDGVNATVDGTFNMPNTFSVGVMVRPVETFTISADYSRVTYGDIRDDFVITQAINAPNGRVENFLIDDANELHFGAEYVFAQARWVPTLRAGAWFDPAHGVYYEPSSLNDSFDERFAASLPQRDDQVHVTFGGGVSLTQQFELNGAADISSNLRLISGSAIFRF